MARTARSKPAAEAEVRRGRRVVRLSHLDRVWWPAEGIRKADVVDYYRAVAPALLPHLRDRPFTFKRHYTGPRSPFEWVKDIPPEAPDWLPFAPLPARSRGGEPVRYALLNDELALLWAVDPRELSMQRVVERVERAGDLHAPLLSRRQRLDSALARLVSG
jgi:DNA primase